MTKLCASCRANDAVKKVATSRVGHFIWKCQSCIDRKSVSFIGAKRADKQ